MPTTEILLVTGDRHRVEGSAVDVESQILAASRGSIMELARLTDAQSGESIRVNPEHVVVLREVTSS